VKHGMHLPVRRLAADFVAPNSVSRYLGRNTTKPLTIDTSQQMPKHVTMYTGFVTRRQTADGKSTSKQQYKCMITITPKLWLVMMKKNFFNS